MTMFSPAERDRDGDTIPTWHGKPIAGLDESLPAAGDEAHRLHDHALAAARGELLPPRCAGRLVTVVGAPVSAASTWNGARRRSETPVTGQT
jgi:hypothetical protein